MRVDTVELGSPDQRGNGRQVLSAIIAVEKYVLAVERNRPDRALDGVAVDLDTLPYERQPRTQQAGMCSSTQPSLGRGASLPSKVAGQRSASTEIR